MYNFIGCWLCSRSLTYSSGLNSSKKKTEIRGELSQAQGNENLRRNAIRVRLKNRWKFGREIKKGRSCKVNRTKEKERKRNRPQAIGRIGTKREIEAGKNLKR